MNRKSTYILVLVFFGVVQLVFGVDKSLSKTKNPYDSKQQQLRSDCVRPTAIYDMNVNNVRARLHNDGSLFEAGQYFTPNNASGTSNVAAIYAAGIWVGGIDRAGNVRLSASGYNQSGSDFFSGPLDINGVTEKQYCDDWDKIFTVKGKNIEAHIAAWKIAKENNVPLDWDKIPDDVKYWPAQGNPFWKEKYPWPLPNQTLADYIDLDEDGKYDPSKGDFPIVHKSGCDVGHFLDPKIPAEINFFIFNDMGGPQTLSGPSKIQMEVQVNAFAYQTNDERNDMTFYQYKLINKATEDILDFYFSFWVDPDLGCYKDDYFGYDKETDIAYIYNQDAVDGDGSDCNGVKAYGDNIPMIGLSFLRKPYGPKAFKRDMNGKLVYDALGQKILIDPEPNTGQQDTLVEIGITAFTYTDNCTMDRPLVYCQPQRGREDGFYNVMTGLWPNGAPVSFGGSGFDPSSLEPVKHVFTGSPNNPNEWSMCTASLPYFDGKFNMSSGPMLIPPGMVNLITINIFSVFDVALPCPDLTKMKYVNGEAKRFLDTCYDDLISSPDAPEISCVENDKKLILILKNNKETSNNYEESYKEGITYLPSGFDDKYRFEGYKIYQLRDESVTYKQHDDPTLARLIAQTDIKNNVADIYNWFSAENPDTSADAKPYIWQPKLMVKGENLGLKHTFIFTEDQFAEGDKTLVNGKKYYFRAVAYAHNDWRPYNTLDNYGQRKSYLDTKWNPVFYSFTPRDNPNQIDTELKVTRISGEGNPNVFLELNPNMYDKMLDNNFDGRITYLTGFGPLKGKVIDPSKLKDKRYRLEITGNFNYIKASCAYEDDAIWTLTNISDNTIVLKDKPLFYIKEYVVEELGFTITVDNHPEPGMKKSENNGGIGAKLDYLNPNGPKWFSAVTKGGKIHDNVYDYLNPVDKIYQDPDNKLSNLGDGYFIPFMSSRHNSMPFFLSPSAREIMWIMQGPALNSLRLRDLNNVDIIMTSDKSKWSKCIVVESTSPDLVAEGTSGNRINFELRSTASIDQNGNPLSDGTIGFSYFPGYAVDVETGKRLNIFFGESSLYRDTILNINGTEVDMKSVLTDGITLGGDMIFNPSSQLYMDDLVIKDPITDEIIEIIDPKGIVAGGQHYIYVTRQEYDGCASFSTKMKRGENGSIPRGLDRAKVCTSITWTSFPILPKGVHLLALKDGLIPNDVIVKLRVDNPYGESRRYNIEREKECDTDGDNPVYEFGFDTIGSFVKTEGELGKVFLVPNPSSLSQNELRLFNLPQNVNVSILNISGNVIKTFYPTEGIRAYLSDLGVTETRFNIDASRMSQGLYFVFIRNNKTGEARTLKWLLL